MRIGPALLGVIAASRRSGAPPAAFANVALLLHFDGAHDSQVFVDSSSYAHTIGEIGSGRLTTLTKKYGTASLTCAATDYLLTVADAAELQVGALDWTLETWMRHNGSGGGIGKVNEWIIEPQEPAGLRKIRIRLGSSGVGYSVDETLPVAAVDAYPINTFFHLAVERMGDVVTVYIDGVSIGTVAFTGAIANTANDWFLGKIPGGGSAFGSSTFIDDLRLTIGQAVYQGPFTPPTSAHPDS